MSNHNLIPKLPKAPLDASNAWFLLVPIPVCVTELPFRVPVHEAVSIYLPRSIHIFAIMTSINACVYMPTPDSSIPDNVLTAYSSKDNSSYRNATDRVPSCTIHAQLPPWTKRTVSLTVRTPQAARF